MNCKQCCYYEAFVSEETGENEDGGRCHRYPPVLFVMEGSPAFDWPVVNDDDQCGEWSGKQ